MKSSEAGNSTVKEQGKWYDKGFAVQTLSGASYINPSGAVHVGHRGIKQMFCLFVLIRELLRPDELQRQALGMAPHSAILSIRTLNPL